MIVHVKAASLKNIDKMMASGSHYDRHRELPWYVYGWMGILTMGHGCFAAKSPPYGMMAERTVVSRAWCLRFPTESMTSPQRPCQIPPYLPGFRSSGAPTKRGETALILGATGVAGKLAVQIAKHLGPGVSLPRGATNKC